MLRPLGFARWDKRFYFSGHLSVRGFSNNFDPQTMASANEDSGQQQQGAVEDHSADRADHDAQRPFDDAGQALEQIAVALRRKMHCATGDPQNPVAVIEGDLQQRLSDHISGGIQCGWGSDVFFHRTAWVGGSEPTVDEAVEFVEEMDARRGRLRVQSVRPI